MEKQEIRLRDALMPICKAFENDGGILETGLVKQLKKYKVSYPDKLSKWLTDNNVVKNTAKSSRRYPQIYWNGGVRPTEKWCENAINAMKASYKMKTPERKVAEVLTYDKEVVSNALFKQGLLAEVEKQWDKISAEIETRNIEIEALKKKEAELTIVKGWLSNLDAL